MKHHGRKHHSKGSTEKAAKRLSGQGRRLLRPWLVVAAALAAGVGLLHSALNATSFPGSFLSAEIGTYGFLTPTNTTCASFSNGSAGALTGGVQYATKLSGKPPSPTISQVNPGVFFYWVHIMTQNPSGTLTFVETADTKLTPNNFFTMASGSSVFTDSCTALKTPALTATLGNATQCAAAGATTSTACYIVTVTGLAANTKYFIGIKYSTSPVVGDKVSSGETVNYSFDTYRNGVLVTNPNPPQFHQSVKLAPK